MPFSFPRPTARSFLACAFACGFLVSIGLPAPTHAAEQEVSISESVYVRGSGRSQYELSIFDRTQTMTEAACEAVPLAQQWSVVEFEANSSYNYCHIETDFNRHKNPYVAVDSSGHLTFAAQPVKIEDLNLGLPSNTVVSSHRFSLMGRNLNTSRVSEGASVRRDDSGDTVHWDEVSEALVAAEGTVEIDDRFHAQEREDFNGISAVEVPTDLQAPNVTTPSSNTGSGALGRAFGTPGMRLVLFSSLFITVVLVVIWAHRLDQHPLRPTRVRPPPARNRLLLLQAAGTTHLSRQRTEHFLLAQRECSPTSPHTGGRTPTRLATASAMILEGLICDPL